MYSLSDSDEAHECVACPTACAICRFWSGVGGRSRCGGGEGSEASMVMGEMVWMSLALAVGV